MKNWDCCVHLPYEARLQEQKMLSPLPSQLPSTKAKSFQILDSLSSLETVIKCIRYLSFSGWKMRGKWLFIRCREILNPFNLYSEGKKKKKGKKVIF